jgi:transmembrane sensor
MINDRIIQILARKLSGESTPAERAELERLLVSDPEAVFYVELISQLWEDQKVKEITSRPVTETDIAYLKHIARFGPVFKRPSLRKENEYGNHFADGIATAAAGQVSIRRKLMRMAALFFLPLLAGSLYYLHSRHDRSPASPPGGESNSAFFAQLGERKTMTLPDGTKVWLNAGSRLSYDSNMLHKGVRDVTLSGEAYFDVAKDKDRCFVIHTDKIAIRVLGTAFDVRAYPQDKITETTLMRGSIELTVNSKPYQKIILKPKEKFALIDDSGDEPVLPNHSQQKPSHPSTKEKLVVQEITPVEVADKEYVKEVSWVENDFVFEDETLEELAPKMERWFNVTMEIENRQIGRLHFTGIFHKETIDQALQAMQLIKPFKYKITDGHVFIN